MLLYIDPGTGSMLFTVLIGIIGTAVYGLRVVLIKIKQSFGGGKAEQNQQKIPIAIFSDDKRYWNIFEPVCREFEERGKELVYLTSSQDDPVFECPYKHVKAEYIGKNNKAFARLNFLNATIVFSTTPGLDVYQWKRSKNVQHYTHIMHAAKEIVLYRMFGVDYYDSLLLSGEYQVSDIRQLEEKRGLPPKELVKVGIPYMDEMAERYKQLSEKPEFAKSSDEQSRTVLLAPTWGPSGILSNFGSKIIDALLKTGYHIIIRPHPQSFDSEKELIEGLMKQYPESEQLEWNRDIDNFEVLLRSDILISDFSGVIFEFALIFDKPVIYHNPEFDVSIYDAWWLSTPLWTTTALPRLGVELTEENLGKIKEVIESCITDAHYTEGRKSVKAETWEHVGEGAKRVADFLLNKYEELTRAEKDH